MGRALYRLGRFCAVHPLIVLLAWIVLAAGVVGAKSALGSMTSNDQTLPGTQSQQASDLLETYFPPQQNGSSPIVFHVSKGKITDQANKNAVESSYKALLKAPHVYSATDPFGNSSSALISTDHTTAFTPVLLSISNGQVTEDLAKRIFAATAPAQKQGIKVAAGGTIGSALSPSPTESSELVGLLTAMLILALTFGSFIAMGVPIITAVLGLTTALGTIGLLTHLFTVPTVGPTLATMIGLGVGIDYALFLLNKYREHMGRGLDHHESIALAVATSGSAIVFAGTTVVIALISLAVAGIPLVTTLGFVTAIAVLTAVTAALTLLPAVVSLLGRHVFGARLPAFARPRHKAAGTGLWARWAGTVTRHPVICGVVALAILAPLIIPLFSLHLGQEDIGVTPANTTERQAFDLLSKEFGPGYNGPLLVAVKLSPPAKESEQYAAQYNQAKALQTDLQNKQKTLTAESNSLKSQQASLQSQQGQLQAQQASLLQQQAALEAQKGSLTQQQAQLLAQKEQLTWEEGQLLNQEAALRQQQAQLVQEQDSLTRQKAQLQQTQAQLQQQRAALVAQIGANRAEFARLTATLHVILALEQRIEGQLAAHDCAAHPSVPPCPALDQALNAVRAREAATRQQIAANQAQFNSLQQQAAQLAAREQQLAGQAAALAQQAAALTQQAAQLQQQANALAAKGASLQAQADALGGQGTSLQGQANALAGQGASLQGQANALAGQGDSLQAQGDSLQQQSESLKAEQQQAENEQKQAMALQQQLTDELTYAGGDPRGTDPRLVKLENALYTPSGVVKVSPPTINKKGNAATFSVIPTTRPAATATADLVTQLRTSVIPPATSTSGQPSIAAYPDGITVSQVKLVSQDSSPPPSHSSITAYVGGVTAGNVDLAAKISSKLFEVIAVVLALSFLLLMIAFRSLLVPLQAALMNLLCVGAAFGVLTATFQWGWGLNLIGLPSPYGTVPIASYVPLMMFAALFGLSMDYEVFLVSQIALHRAAGEEPRQAVRSGLAAAAKVISAAAIIMIAVFASFILNSDPTVKQFGVGLSVAVLLAGTMTLLLAPALLSLFGRWTWILPRWLAKVIPHVDIEGERAPQEKAEEAEALPAATTAAVLAGAAPSGPGADGPRADGPTANKPGPDRVAASAPVTHGPPAGVGDGGELLPNGQGADQHAASDTPPDGGAAGRVSLDELLNRSPYPDSARPPDQEQDSPGSPRRP
jgi:uncharacterized membrane protein YdfJ with MMPL/SSD domain